MAALPPLRLSQLPILVAAVLLGILLYRLVAFFLFRRRLLSRIALPCASAADLSNRFTPEKLSTATNGGGGNKCDVVVVGSGISGLAAATLLAKTGRRVIVLEQHSTLGGTLHTYRRAGASFDAGVSILGAAFFDPSMPLGHFLAALTVPGLRAAKLSNCAVVRVAAAGRSFDVPFGLADLETALAEEFPDEQQAIHACLSRIAGIGELQARAWAAAQGVLPMIISAALRLKMKLKREDVLLRMTMDDFFDSCGLLDDTLRKLIGYLWPLLGVPSNGQSIAAYAGTMQSFNEGAVMPVGGASAIVQHMLAVFSAHGGVAFTEAPVVSLLVDGGRCAGVQLQTGEVIRAGSVLCACGARQTFSSLLPAAVRQQYNLPEQFDEFFESMSVASLHTVLDGEQGDLGLPSVFHDFDESQPLAGFPTKSLLIYASPQSVGMARPGTTAVSVFVEVRNDAFQQWEHSSHGRRPAEYTDLKSAIKNELLERLHTLFPKTRGSVRYSEVATGSTLHHYLGRGDGYVGRAATSSSILNPIKLRTAVPGLFVAGEDTMFGGVPSAFITGVAAAGAIASHSVLLM